MTRTALRFAAFVIALLPSAASAQQERLPAEDLKIVQQKWPTAKKTGTGLRYVIEIEGTGELAKRGDLVKVLYVGMTLDGKVFDKEENPLTPLEFRIGRGLVIQGWEQGMQLVRRGTKATIIVPPYLAYGTRGDPAHGIPRNATLVFEVSVLDVIHEAPASASGSPAAGKPAPVPDQKKK